MYRRYRRVHPSIHTSRVNPLITPLGLPRSSACNPMSSAVEGLMEPRAGMSRKHTRPMPSPNHLAHCVHIVHIITQTIQGRVRSTARNAFAGTHFLHCRGLGFRGLETIVNFQKLREPLNAHPFHFFFLPLLRWISPPTADTIP